MSKLYMIVLDNIVWIVLNMMKYFSKTKFSLQAKPDIKYYITPIMRFTTVVPFERILINSCIEKWNVSNNTQLASLKKTEGY